MRNKTILLAAIGMMAMVALLTACAGQSAKPTESNFQMPVVSLSHVEVEHYYGYWYFSNKVKPTKGNAGNYGAPLDMAFIFEIQNPNPFPVMMEEFKFSAYFEEFEVNTLTSTETMWIPAGKTNQIRVHCILDTRQTLLTLLLPGAMKLKEKGMSPWDALEKWWTEAPEFSFPIYAKGGSAVFKADGMVKVAAFEASFP